MVYVRIKFKCIYDKFSLYLVTFTLANDVPFLNFLKRFTSWIDVANQICYWFKVSFYFIYLHSYLSVVQTHFLYLLSFSFLASLYIFQTLFLSLFLLIAFLIWVVGSLKVAWYQTTPLVAAGRTTYQLKITMIKIKFENLKLFFVFYKINCMICKNV